MKSTLEKNRFNGSPLFITKWDNPTFGEMIAHEARLRLPGSPNKTKQLQAFRDSEESVTRVSEDLQKMFHELGQPVDWNVVPEFVGAELSSMEHSDFQQALFDRHTQLIENLELLFLNDLAQAAKNHRVGEITWMEPDSFGRSTGCRFNFYDTDRSRTITKIRTRTFDHVHDLINAKKHPLPALDVKQPKRCQKIIRAMPVWMQVHSYIVTGDVISMAVRQVDETEVDNELVRMAKKVGRGVQTAASATAATAANFMSSINTKIMEDPALVVGDRAFYGWID